MENRIVGFIVLGLAGVIGLVTLLFNRALTNIVNVTCSHGESCPMWQSINVHTNISLILMGVIILIGLYLVFSEQLDKMVFKPKPEQTLPQQDFNKVLTTLSIDEKTVFEKLIDAQGSIFQTELVEKSGFNKVKVTRLLDKLEGRNLIERKRRGMSNIVILKH
tara:strand:+ start:4197 stop:4685 length:489 start_codon:yes stop_codon:yes gene_type:complete